MSETNYRPILKLPMVFDVERLNALFESQGVFDRFGESSTVSLMHRQGVLDPWTDGLTASVLTKEQPLYFSEADFNRFNPGLSGTYFQSVYEQMSEKFKNRLGRFRIFKRESQTSSSLHQDLDVRFHLALKTNPGSFLVFPQIGIFQIPADGHLYLVDTTQPHFAVNASASMPRIHLVCSTYCGVLERRENEAQIIEAHRAFFSQISHLTSVGGL